MLNKICVIVYYYKLSRQVASRNHPLLVAWELSVLSFSSQYPSGKKAKKAHNPIATLVTKALDKSKRLLGDCIVLCLFSDTSKLSLTRVLTIFTRCLKDEFSFTSYVCFCKLPTDNSLATAKFTALWHE